MTEPFVSDSSDEPTVTGKETGGQLRSLLEEQLRINSDLKAKVASLESVQSERAVSETWSKLKVPPKFQAAYLGDKSPEAIEKWWADISPLVNLEGPNVDEQPAETQEQRVQREAIVATQRASSLGGDFASNIDEGMAKAQELRARTGAAITKAELDDVFNKLGVKDY